MRRYKMDVFRYSSITYLPTYLLTIVAITGRWWRAGRVSEILRDREGERQETMGRPRLRG